MQTILRILLLGLFAAAGISAAVGVALHLQKDALPAAMSKGNEIVSTAPAFRQPPQRPGQQAQTVTGTAIAEVAPTAADYRQQVGQRAVVNQQIDRLEKALERVEASSRRQEQQRQDQIQRLEASLQRAEDAARQRQINRIEIALARMQDSNRLQQQAPHETTDQRQGKRPGLSTELALAQTIRIDGDEDEDDDTNADETNDPVRGGAGEPEFSRQEGDGKLTINAKKTDVRDLLHWLSEQGDFNIVASNTVQGSIAISLTGVDVQTALDAVLNMTGFVARREGQFIYVGTPQDLEKMDHLRDRIGTRIYRTNYVQAAELQTLIAPLLSKEGKTTVSSPAEIDIPADEVHTGGDKFAASEVLMVRDYERILSKIDNVVAEIDQRPQQVSIEAMILSVNLDDSDVLGVNFELLRNHNNVRIVSGSPLANLATMDFSEGGLNFGFLDSSLATFVQALETIGDTNVIATPRLMCLNKQRAEILIGQQRGYLTTTQTETATTQSVEFLEVGTQLRIRPFISQDGMIRMEIHPELSTGDVRLIGDFALPDKEVTQVTTNIICKDGGTIVIGGLIRNEMGTTTTQIPLLGNLPLLGTLFRNKTETITRNEIIVLITPRIVGEPGLTMEGRHTVAQIDQRNSIYADQMTPVGKRYYGRRYHRMAQEAWQAGDLRRAMKYINLSIHFDPLNSQAIEFRNMIAPDGGPPLSGETIMEGLIEEKPLEKLPPPALEIRSSRRQRKLQPASR